MPYTYLIDETATVKDRDYIVGNYYNWKTHSYDKTFTLNKGIYTFGFETGLQYNVSNNTKNLKLMDYKNLSMNVLSTSFDKVQITDNNFTMHNLFNADVENLDFQRWPDNISYKNVSRRINTLPSSSIRFTSTKM